MYYTSLTHTLAKHRLVAYSKDTTARWGKLQSQEEKSLLDYLINSIM